MANLRFARPDATDQQVIQACQAAQVHDVIVLDEATSHLDSVIADGRVVQRGTHADLVDAEGIYAELHRTQFARV